MLRPPHCFVIVTQGRAGSELLVEMLRSQPGVQCDGELLAQPSRFPGLRVRVAAARSVRHRVKVYGWKLVLHQVADPAGLVGGLTKDGWVPIVLSRRNHLEQAVSAFRARVEGQWHHRGTAPAPEPVTLDPEAVVAQLVISEARESVLAGLAARERSISLVYEDDLAEPSMHEPTVRRVMETFGLPSRPLRSEVLRRPPRPLSEAVANYDAVAALVRHTRFAHYLD